MSRTAIVLEKETVEKVKTLFDQDKKPAYIAKELGVSVLAVKRTLGIVPNKRTSKTQSTSWFSELGELLNSNAEVMEELAGKLDNFAQSYSDMATQLRSKASELRSSLR